MFSNFFSILASLPKVLKIVRSFQLWLDTQMKRHEIDQAIKLAKTRHDTYGIDIMFNPQSKDDE